MVIDSAQEPYALVGHPEATMGRIPLFTSGSSALARVTAYLRRLEAIVLAPRQVTFPLRVNTAEIQYHENGSNRN